LDRSIAVGYEKTVAAYEKGRSYEKMLDWEKSAECFEDAIQYDPSYCNAYFGKGLALNNMGKYEEAIESYNKCAALNPGYRKFTIT
jgi:tetratricopeptide (TPR) repeat protein